MTASDEPITCGARGDATATMAQVLRVALPLIVASSGHALRLFADRVMLARYSQASIAAALPAGLMSFVGMSLFIGTAGYVSAFVAQFTGSGQNRRVGPAVWQGLYLALLGGLAMQIPAVWAPQIFAWAGHAADVRAEQVVYFRVLSRFAFAGIALATLNGFWSGRGQTRTVMIIELCCALANVLFNALFIFGRGGFPRMGIYGAGLATGLSNLLGMLVMLTLFLRSRHRARFGTWPRRTLDGPLLRRVLRFGFPNGLQFMLDMLAFNLFVVFLGRAGSVALEAAGIAFGLNALAFLPIVGMGMAVSILVGQGVGAGHIPFARSCVRRALALALIYNAVVGAVFWFRADSVLALFARAGDPEQAATFVMAKLSLRFITAYLVFDAFYIVYSHAIKGAGDTHFSMMAGTALSWGTLVFPSWVAARLAWPASALWSILVGHIVLAGAVFFWRYRSGVWEGLRVIEPSIPESFAPVEPLPPPIAGG
jgi:multidrug resistance protein, MATE family